MCFTLAWLVDLIVKLIIVYVVVFGLYRIWIAPSLARRDGRIAQTIDLVVWAAVAIFVLYVCYDLIVCAWSSGHLIGRR